VNDYDVANLLINLTQVQESQFPIDDVYFDMFSRKNDETLESLDILQHLISKLGNIQVTQMIYFFMILKYFFFFKSIFKCILFLLV